MKLKMYAIHDNQAEIFMRPMYFNTEGLAKRAFLNALVSEESEISRFPADYALYEIGEYDDENGIPAGKVPERICTGTELLTQRKADVERIAALHQEIDEIQSPGGTQ